MPRMGYTDPQTGEREEVEVPQEMVRHYQEQGATLLDFPGNVDAAEGPDGSAIALSAAKSPWDLIADPTEWPILYEGIGSAAAGGAALARASRVIGEEGLAAGGKRIAKAGLRTAGQAIKRRVLGPLHDVGTFVKELRGSAEEAKDIGTAGRRVTITKKQLEAAAKKQGYTLSKLTRGEREYEAGKAIGKVGRAESRTTAKTVKFKRVPRIKKPPETLH